MTKGFSTDTTLHTPSVDKAAWRALLFVTLAATAVVAPFAVLGDASGHDFTFHLSSWVEVARQWHQGVFYPRWAEWANYGFGEPRFIFYPPLSWLLGAALGLVLPWKVVPAAFIWLALVGAGASMFRLAREWLPAGSAAAAAVFFAANPYHLIIVYYRSDFAELLASALLPLAFLFALRMSRQGARGGSSLAVVFALIWLANAPAGVIATYSLVLLLGVVSWIERSPRALLRGAGALTGGFGLAAFYLVPAAWERSWAQIHQVLAQELRPEANFLFSRLNDPEFVRFNWKVSWVALAVLIVLVLATVITHRSRRRIPELWWPLVVEEAFASFLLLSASWPLWRILPELRFLQFPWRWLLVLSLVAAIFLTLAAERAKRPWLIWAVVFVALAGAGAAIVRDAWWDSEDAQNLLSAIQSGRGYEGADEYAPIGCDRTELPENSPRAALATDVQERARIHIERWTAEKKLLSVDVLHPATIALKLVNYPAWRAEVNGQPATLGSKPPTSQVVLPLVAGHNEITVTFRQTTDRTLGGILSLISALVLAGIALRRRD
jgi:6-pyruvoyl-tetrahydropterin synthase related domain